MCVRLWDQKGAMPQSEVHECVPVTVEVVIRWYGGKVVAGSKAGLKTEGSWCVNPGNNVVVW